MDLRNHTCGIGSKSKHRIMALLLLLVVGGLVGTVQAQTADGADKNETSAQRTARMAWWRQARFGMFIHWGVYAVPAGTHDGVKINSHWRMDYEQGKNISGRLQRIRQAV